MTASAPSGEALSLTDITGKGQDADQCAPGDVTDVMSANSAANLAVILKALADPLRVRMLSHLAQVPAHEACVCDLAELADVSQPTVSHHLKVLRDAGVLTGERRGTWVWYAIAPEYATPISTLLTTFVDALPLPTDEEKT